MYYQLGCPVLYTNLNIVVFNKKVNSLLYFYIHKSIVVLGYRVEMLDIQTGRWIEVTFIEGYEPKCTLSNILYGIMYRFRVIALNDAGASEPGEPSEPIVIDVPGVQIAPYFVQMLNDTIALEHEKVMIYIVEPTFSQNQSFFFERLCFKSKF